MRFTNSNSLPIAMFNKSYGLTSSISSTQVEVTKQKSKNIESSRLFPSDQRKTSTPESRQSVRQLSERRHTINCRVKIEKRSFSSDRWLINYSTPKISFEGRNSRHIRIMSESPKLSDQQKSPTNGKVMLSISQSLSNTGSDIVKQGYLYVKRPPGNRWNKFKAWHKRYFVLKESGDERGPELIMYTNQQEFKARNHGTTQPSSPLANHHPLNSSSTRKTSSSNPASLSMFVQETVHIGITSESHRFQHVLVVVFSGRAPLLLAAEDELTARMWRQALDLTSSRDSGSNNGQVRTNLWTTTSPKRNGSMVKLGPTTTTNNDVVTSNDHHDEDCGYINHPDISNNNNNNNNYSGATICGSVGSEGSGCSCVPAFIRESSLPDSPLGSSGTGTGETGTSGTCDKSCHRQSNMSLHSTTPSPIPDFYDEKINVGQVVERFPIYFIPTEDSERIGLRGPLQLVIYSVTIGIARKGDKECFILWPINVIRQYRLDSYQCSNTCSKSSKVSVGSKKDQPKSSNSRSFYRSKSSSSSSSSKSSSNSGGNKRLTLVTIEVGRRCTTGEGIYKFSTECGEDIIREIKKTVNNLAAQNSSNTEKDHGHFRRRTHSSGAKHTSPPIGRASDNARRCLSSMAEFPDPFRPRTFSGSTLKPAAAGLTVARAAALARLKSNQVKTLMSNDLNKINKSKATLVNQVDKVLKPGNGNKNEVLVTKSSSDIRSPVYTQPFFTSKIEKEPRVDESLEKTPTSDALDSGSYSDEGNETTTRTSGSEDKKGTAGDIILEVEGCNYVTQLNGKSKVESRKTISTEQRRIDTLDKMIEGRGGGKGRGSKDSKEQSNGCHVVEDDPYLEIVEES